MDAAARQFIGTHDFAAFCSAGGSVEDTVRTITAASVAREGALVTFSVTGGGFLYNMVRIMTGTLLEVSRGALAPSDIPRILAGRDRAAAGPTAPPHGSTSTRYSTDFSFTGGKPMAQLTDLEKVRRRRARRRMVRSLFILALFAAVVFLCVTVIRQAGDLDLKTAYSDLRAGMASATDIPSLCRAGR